MRCREEELVYDTGWVLYGIGAPTIVARLSLLGVLRSLLLLMMAPIAAKMVGRARVIWGDSLEAASCTEQTELFDKSHTNTKCAITFQRLAGCHIFVKVNPRCP